MNVGARSTRKPDIFSGRQSGEIGVAIRRRRSWCLREMHGTVKGKVDLYMLVFRAVVTRRPACETARVGVLIRSLIVRQHG